MKCTIKVSHRDIKKFREIQKLRKKLESFQKSSNEFEIFNTKEPVVEIIVNKRFPFYPFNDKDLEQLKEAYIAEMAAELSKYIVDNNLWELKEYQDAGYGGLKAMIRIATNKTGD